MIKKSRFSLENLQQQTISILKSQIFFLILLGVFLLIPSKAFAIDPTGSFDGADCNYWGGWASDADNCTQAIRIDFYDENWQGLTSVYASNFRQDLVNANVCNYNGNHGFYYNWSANTALNRLKDGGTHTIHALAVNIGAGPSSWIELPSAKTISGCKVNLSGRVINAATGAGMSGVTINTGNTCLNANTTDVNGYFNYSVNYGSGFCLRAPTVSGYTLATGGYECQIAGGYFNPDACGRGTGNPTYPTSLDLTSDITYNFSYTPYCNTGTNCTGSCVGAPANTCSTNNGYWSGGCTNTAYIGGGNCIPQVVPTLACTQSNCQAGYNCNSGTCVAQTCDSSYSCGPCGGGATNTCSNNGTQTCYRTTHSNGLPCVTQITNPTCSIDRCNNSSNYFCQSGSCVWRPNCNTGGTCGACTPQTPSNRCTNNGLTSCTYTAHTGGGLCVTTTNNSVPCDVFNCLAPTNICDSTTGSPTFGTCITNTSFSTQCPLQNTNPRADGLITAPEISNNFGNLLGQCIYNTNRVYFDNTLVYDYLYTNYYTQSTATKNTDALTTLTTPSADNVYHYTNSAGASTGGLNYNYSRASVVFVEGNLSINGDITDNTVNATGGALVIVVKGNVLVNENVRRIDAAIISQGIIYTAVDPTDITNPDTCTRSTENVGASTNALTVNGNLISLNQVDTTPIVFCRTLTDNNDPAEIINQQPKYLVLLRNIFSTNTQKWTEITSNNPLPSVSPAPSSVPSPIPSPSSAPSPSPVATNLAVNRPVTVSPNGEPNASFPRGRAVDGIYRVTDANNRWNSNVNESAYIYVDLGTNRTVNRVVIEWESGWYWGTNYNIQVSTDATNWTTVFTRTGFGGGTVMDTMNFSPATARYVRMQGVNTHNTSFYSIHEMEVWGY